MLSQKNDESLLYVHNGFLPVNSGHPFSLACDYQIDSIVAEKGERVIKFGLKNEKKTLWLYFELFGRRTNVLLVDPETNIILRVLTPVDSDKSRKRLLLSGITYSPMPKTERICPFEEDEEKLSLWLSDKEKARNESTVIPKAFGGT
jgi:predicted ribosome quality control (RQC) complex YloA/Tae2 family protein